MSEHLGEKGEHRLEAIDTTKESEHRKTERDKRAEQSPETTPASVERLKHQAESHAVSGKEIRFNEQTERHQPLATTRALKRDAYTKTIQKIRNQLSPSERLFSRLVHQPAIEKVSNAGAQTIARSSGLLGGAVVAFSGSVGLLLAAKRYGFTYNYLVFFILFGAGFVVGLLLEVVFWLVRVVKR